LDGLEIGVNKNGQDWRKTGDNERRAGMTSDTPMTDTAHELLGKHGKVSVYRMETLERAYNEMTRRTLAYERAIRLTLKEQEHLADGDNCTLIELKRALRDNAPMVLADDVQADDKLHARPTVETMRRWFEKVQQHVTGAGILWQTIAAGIDRTPENEAEEQAMDSRNAQADVDISGAAGSVKK
jgi:hypothetical protein